MLDFKWLNLVTMLVSYNVSFCLQTSQTAQICSLHTEVYPFDLRRKCQLQCFLLKTWQTAQIFSFDSWKSLHLLYERISKLCIEDRQGGWIEITIFLTINCAALARYLRSNFSNMFFWKKMFHSLKKQLVS